MASNLVSIQRRGFGQTMRKDWWWVSPLLTFLGLGAFVVYSTWAAFQGEHYLYEGGGAHYISPFYSPEILGGTHSMFGPKPAWFPAWLPFSPALLILWAPGGFRFTCYYYRGAYYKAFWADPLACAVGEPRHNYRGEKKFPLILQNIHRYFLYLALIFIVFLVHDIWKAIWFIGPDGQAHLGVGVGTLVLAANAVCLSLYTFSCHSLRHLIGGAWDVLSNKPVRKAAYGCVSGLNKRHMQFAWLSLFVVGFSDIYVRLCSMGIWTDYKLL
jgi:hypothetical protein